MVKNNGKSTLLIIDFPVPSEREVEMKEREILDTDDLGTFPHNLAKRFDEMGIHRKDFQLSIRSY